MEKEEETNFQKFDRKIKSVKIKILFVVFFEFYQF